MESKYKVAHKSRMNETGQEGKIRRKKWDNTEEKVGKYGGKQGKIEGKIRENRGRGKIKGKMREKRKK